MNQVDKDLIVLGCIASVVQDIGKKMTDLVPEFDGDKVVSFAESQSVYLSDKSTDDAIKELAKECYTNIMNEIEARKNDTN